MFPTNCLSISATFSFAGYTFDIAGFISLAVTLLILWLIWHIPNPSIKPPEPRNSLLNNLRNYLGEDRDISILNAIFILAGFLALLATVRKLLLTSVLLLEDQWNVAGVITSISDVLSISLLLFIILTLVDLTKATKKKSEGHFLVPKLLEVGIIALVIALLQFIPQFTEYSLYENWLSTPYSLPTLLIIVISGIAVFSLLDS